MDLTATLDLFRQVPAAYLSMAGLGGLLLGSFLNVVISRLPAMETAGGAAMSLVFPASQCPACGHAIRWQHNLPLLGYLLLGGRCADCRTRIPVRYPLVEGLSAAVAVAVFAAFGPTLPALAVTGFLMVLLALAVIDLEQGLLPDRLTLPGLWAGLLVNAFFLVTTPKEAVLGAVVCFLAMSGLRHGYALLRHTDGMGGGDPKLAAMIGAWVGLELALPALLLAFALGTLAGVLMLARRRADMHTAVPFGPALCCGAVIAVLGRDELRQLPWWLLG